MRTRIAIVLLAALALFSSFHSGANARGDCDDSYASAYARPRC